jgi:subtilase family serine protease
MGRVHRRGRRSAMLAAIAAMTLAGASAGAGSAQAAAPRALTVRDLGPVSTVTDSVPKLSTLRVMGQTPDSTSAMALVSIQHRNQAGLLKLISAVSTPGNPEYEHYLTAQQFDAAYAPSDAMVKRVESYLTGFGLRVQNVPANRAYVVVDGTVGQMANAFATRFDYYLKDGMIFHTPVVSLSIPASLSGVITGVTGLDNGDIDTPQDTPPYPAYINAPPFSTYFNSTMATQAPGYGSASTLGNVIQGYTPQQIEGAYGVTRAISDGLDGAGETVAVIDAYSSPTIDSDVDEWSALHDLPAPNLTVDDNVAERTQPDAPAVPTDVPVVGGADLLDPSGWFGEETLDIEAVHTMAPDAHIIMQGALSPEDATLEMAQNSVVQADQAQEVSNSYAGSGDGTDTTSDGYWQQAAAEGMGVQFSTGDDGDNTDGETELADQGVNTDPNSPYVTAVGGTTLAVGASDNYEWETYWGEQTATLSDGRWGTVSADGGGGGGVTQYYSEPTWQKGVVPNALADYWQTYKPQSSSDDAAVSACTAGENPSADSCAVYPGRVLPDVSMLADPNTGFQMGLTMDDSVYSDPDAIALPTDTDAFAQFRIGGTSLASPLFAGMMALVDQANIKPIGFADPTLYSLYAKDSSAFHKIDTSAPVPGVVRTNYTNSVNAAGGTSTVLRTFDNGYTLSTAAGYNDSTGLGSPDGMSFICGMTANAKVAQDVPGSPCATAAAGTTPSTQACTRRLSETLTYRLIPGAGVRERKVIVYVNGKKLKTLTGRRLLSVSLKRPAATKFTVKYVNTLSDGKVVAHSFTYNGCKVSKPTITILHPARKK